MTDTAQKTDLVTRLAKASIGDASTRLESQMNCLQQAFSEGARTPEDMEEHGKLIRPSSQRLYLMEKDCNNLAKAISKKPDKKNGMCEEVIDAYKAMGKKKSTSAVEFKGQMEEQLRDLRGQQQLPSQAFDSQPNVLTGNKKRVVNDISRAIISKINENYRIDFRFYEHDDKPSQTDDITSLLKLAYTIGAQSVEKPEPHKSAPYVAPSSKGNHLISDYSNIIVEENAQAESDALSRISYDINPFRPGQQGKLLREVKECVAASFDFGRENFTQAVEHAGKIDALAAAAVREERAAAAAEQGGGRKEGKFAARVGASRLSTIAEGEEPSSPCL